MASAKQNQQAAPKDDFDISQYLPKGFDAKDVYRTGGLTPIFQPENAFETASVVAGRIDRLVMLPPQRKGTSTEWQPAMVLVRDILKPTKGMRKVGNNYEEVEVEAGKDILVPVTGSLSVNKELILALMDKKNVHFGVFRVTGREKVNDQPSPMWVWEVYLHTKTTPREGVYALDGQDAGAKMFFETSDGSTVHAETGEVLNRDGSKAGSLVDKQPSA